VYKSVGWASKPLIDRVATLCGEKIGTLNATDCWQWGGALSRFMPMLRHRGKVRPARRALYEDQIRPLEPYEHVRLGGCATLLCVNPWHMMVTGGVPSDLPLDPVFEVEDLSLDDIADMIMERDDRDPRSISIRLDITSTRAEEALAWIVGQNL